MTDMDAVVVNYEPDSDEFKRIAVQSLGQKSHCMYGPSFLVFERSTGHFLESLCGTKSTRGQAKNIYPFLPLARDERPDGRNERGEPQAGRQRTSMP
jgi:hypothetical protein